MEQVSLQDDELSAMRKELQDRDEQLQVMGQNFNQATLALTELRDASDVLRDEKTRCEQQLQTYAARIAHVESQREGLTQQLEALQTDRRSLDDQLNEYEALLASVKKNAERKDEASAVRYQNVCARLRELNSVVEHKERRIDELEDASRALQHDLDAARHDCEGMLNVLTGMEKQLTQYCEREDAVATVRTRHLVVGHVVRTTTHCPLDAAARVRLQSQSRRGRARERTGASDGLGHSEALTAHAGRVVMVPRRSSQRTRRRADARSLGSSSDSRRRQRSTCAHWTTQRARASASTRASSRRAKTKCAR